MQGGVKFYRGSASAARSYVEADRSRVDDYYLAEGTGVATRYVATTPPVEGGRGVSAVQEGGTLDGDAYERWVAGYHVETGAPKGRLRNDDRALRFVEIVVNGPKTWSLAATLHPEIAMAFDAAQDRAAVEIVDWLANHATTRVGPRGRQVQVPVEQLEAAVVRHYTSRAGDPHRHLHLQINARVFAVGSWRGLHSAGVVDSIGAINGIGHGAVACDPEFRKALAAHGYTLDPATGEVSQLAPYAGGFSARAAQITRNIDRYDAEWRTEHPRHEPGPALRRGWDRRAWSAARPDKVVPEDGTELRRRWVEELHELGFTPPPRPLRIEKLGTATDRVRRDAVTALVLSRLGARRSSWNAADIRGEVERIVVSLDIVDPTSVRCELTEDLTARTVAECERLLHRDDVPEHVRGLTSTRVLEVEADLTTRLVARAEHAGASDRVGHVVAGRKLDPAQREVVAALAGSHRLLVIEGAAGAGKTTTLAAAHDLLAMQARRLVVVTPTLKAARVAEQQIGTDAYSAAWLIHQHGFRWNDDGDWSRVPAEPDARVRLLPGDVLLVDEAGMLDQDIASALLTIADHAHAGVAFVGDRHQLPAVGRGGVLDHAARWAHPEACLTLETVHRFTDPEYADLSLLMRTGERSGEVFDALFRRGEIAIHHSEVERLAALTTSLTNSPTNADGLVVADTRDQVRAINAAYRDHRLTTGQTAEAKALTTTAGERLGIGDRIATRRNDRDLDVANRDCWTVTGIDDDGTLHVRGRPGSRVLPATYARKHVELAYATTVHGAQGETVPTCHLLVGETTGAAAAYVGMTRGRNRNTAHLVADTVEDARSQWIDVFSRDGADLGPRHAAAIAEETIDRYGPQTRKSSHALQAAALRQAEPPKHEPPVTATRSPSRGIGR